MELPKEALHRAWVNRLRREWIELNEFKLEKGLSPPVFRIGVGQKTLGTFEPATRVLSISESHILKGPWADVVQTLAHEMAHQVVFELWGVTGEPPHGPSFKRALKLFEDGQSHSPLLPEEERVLDKVHKLLSLAQSENLHEAESAMAFANTLLLRHNLSYVEDRPRGFVSRRLGGESRAIPLHWKLIGSVLSEYFFVECIWVTVYLAEEDKDTRQLEISGTPANVQMAEYVHEFLHRAAESLWREKKKGTKGGSRAFKTGVILGFKEKLGREKARNAEKGLVWIADPELSAFFRRRYPRTGVLRGRGVRSSPSFEAGKNEGRRLVIRRGVHEKGGGDRIKSLDT